MHMNQLIRPTIVYPEDDGNPLAENTEQLEWIVLIYDNILGMFRARDDVFVASDLLWYPEEWNTVDRLAPDVMVAFGRPQGFRSSYRQWEENDVAPQVVFEIMSPSNGHAEMVEKQSSYEDWGVEEYYVYDPRRNQLFVYERSGEMLRRVRKIGEYVSKRLGIRFQLTAETLLIFRPNGELFRPYKEIEAEMEREREQRVFAEQRQRDAEQRLARLQWLSRRVRRGEATAEELAELEHIEQEP